MKYVTPPQAFLKIQNLQYHKKTNQLSLGNLKEVEEINEKIEGKKRFNFSWRLSLKMDSRLLDS